MLPPRFLFCSDISLRLGHPRRFFQPHKDAASMCSRSHLRRQHAAGNGGPGNLGGSLPVLAAR